MKKHSKRFVALVLAIILGFSNVVFADYSGGDVDFVEHESVSTDVTDIYELYISEQMDEYAPDLTDDEIGSETSDTEESEAEEGYSEIPDTEEPGDDDYSETLYTEEPGDDDYSEILDTEERETGDICPEMPNEETGEALELLPFTGKTLGVADTSVSASTSSLSECGNYVDVVISLDSNPGILGLLATLVFDETVLTLVDIQESYGLSDLEVVLPSVDGRHYSNELVFLVFGKSDLYETGEVATIRFAVNGEYYNELSITLCSVEVVTDDGYGEMLIDEVLNQDTVSNSQDEIVAFSIPISPTSSSIFDMGNSGILLGDVNGDGLVTIVDATLLGNHVNTNSSIANRRGADLNLSGAIDTTDVTILNRMLQNQDVSTTAGRQPNSLTIVPYDILGNPLLNADIEVFVNNNSRITAKTNTGVISVRNIPHNSNVRYNVSNTGGNHGYGGQLLNFHSTTHGLQLVNLTNAISIDSISAARGAEVTVRVRLRSNPGVVSFRPFIEYDTTRLRFVEEIRGNTLGNFNFVRPNQLWSPFSTFWHGVNNNHGVGTLLTLRFTVLDSAPVGNAFVRVRNTEAHNTTVVNGNYVSVPFSGTWGYIDVLPSTLLAGLMRTSNTEPATMNPWQMSTGLFRTHSHLTAWNNNSQVALGDSRHRTPINFRNNSVPQGWRPHRLAGINNATAFQFRLRTKGFNNIRFSAKMVATGNGPNTWELAWSTSPTGSFTLIPNSTTTNRQAPSSYRTDTYNDFNWVNAGAYNMFTLPAIMADRDDIYLRIVYNGTFTASDGNIGINDIMFVGDPIQ